MSKQDILQEIHHNLFVTYCNLEKNIARARREFSGVGDNDRVLNEATDFLETLKRNQKELGSFNLDELSEVVLAANSVLINLQKWMILGYAHAVVSASASPGS